METYLTVVPETILNIATDYFENGGEDSTLRRYVGILLKSTGSFKRKRAENSPVCGIDTKNYYSTEKRIEKNTPPRARRTVKCCTMYYGCGVHIEWVAFHIISLEPTSIPDTGKKSNI